MHYYACYFVLATMNYNCFKDFMEKRHYINKKKNLHAGHVWYNYFFFFFLFFFSFWLGNGHSKTYGMAFILLFYCFMTFLSSERKSATLEPSSHESLHLLQNCFELLRTSASHCKCTEGIPCQRCQKGLKI